MAERGTKNQDKRETMLLRGANGMLYRIPPSTISRFAVPPEELGNALKHLEQINPLLAAQDIAGEAGAPTAKAYSAAMFPTLISGPVRAKKPVK